MRKYQAAKLKVIIDNEIRMEELVCDGIIVSTAAGSTGYNYSASGPIVPLGSNVMAMTAVSAYSPRHWKGGLLKDNAKIRITNIVISAKNEYCIFSVRLMLSLLDTNNLAETNVVR